MNADNFPDPNYRTTCYVMTLSRADFALLEEMLKISREKIPTMRSVDDICAAIVTEACRRWREAGGTPALPGVNPS